MSKSNKATGSNSKVCGISFSYNKKIVPILRIFLKVGQTKQKSDIGEVLYEMTTIFGAESIPLRS